MSAPLRPESAGSRVSVHFPESTRFHPPKDHFARNILVVFKAVSYWRFWVLYIREVTVTLYLSLQHYRCPPGPFRSHPPIGRMGLAFLSPAAAQRCHGSQ